MYSFTVPRTQHLTYTGTKVGPWFTENVDKLVFEEYGLRPRAGGDSLHRRDRGHYHVAILTGGVHYIVAISYNLGLEPRAEGEDSHHRGYLLIDYKIVGASLADALRAAARLLDDLVISADYQPSNSDDRRLFETGRDFWEKEVIRAARKAVA